MDLGSILLILALALLVALFVSRPFMDRKMEAEPLVQRAAVQADHERSALLADRDQVLNALKELDFDHTIGKIPPEDYPVQRAALMAKGAEVLRRLDVLAPGTNSGGSAEDRLEAALAERRAQRANAAQKPEGDAFEAALAARRAARSDGGFCPKCGKPVQKSDKFCARCGAETR